MSLRASHTQKVLIDRRHVDLPAEVFTRVTAMLDTPPRAMRNSGGSCGHERRGMNERPAYPDQPARNTHLPR